MKLAFVHKRYGLDGGTERFMEGLCRGLSARGHEVSVFVARLDPRFARTKVARFRRLISAGPGTLFRALSLWVSSKIAVRRRDYDLVVGFGRTGPHNLYRAGGGCHRVWFDALRSRSSHPLERFLLDWNPYHRFLLWHEKTALSSPSVTTVVPSQRALLDLQQAYGGLADGVKVLPNGVDLDRFHPKLRRLFFEESRSKLGLDPEDVVVLFVGSDFWRKGLDTLIRALGHLSRTSEVKLLIVGGDPRRKEFEGMAERCGLGGRLVFLRSAQAMERTYAVADVMALPTRHDPFANVTLEALATGLPVVTSRRNGATEAPVQGLGFRVVEDEEDDIALAAVLEDLLFTPGAQQRREQARASVEACGEKPCVDRWESLFLRLGEGGLGG